MKRYIRSSASAAVDEIQRFIDGYGFSDFTVYERTDEWLAIDVEGQPESEIDSLATRLDAYGLDVDRYDHYIEIYIGDDSRW